MPRNGSYVCTKRLNHAIKSKEIASDSKLGAKNLWTDCKDTERGRMVISENSDYLKDYEILHIFITFSRNRVAWHTKWSSIMFAEFRFFRNKWDQSGSIFGHHTLNCNAMFERTIDSFVVKISA